MIIYIGGTFDCFHSGHINLLKEAKKMGEVVVSVNTDAFAERYKRRPLMPLFERIKVLEACKYVDRVMVNTGNEDSRVAILNSGADVILHGDDWTGESLMKQLGVTPEWLEEHGIEMRYIPYTKGISTTEILNAKN